MQQPGLQQLPTGWPGLPGQNAPQPVYQPPFQAPPGFQGQTQPVPPVAFPASPYAAPAPGPGQPAPQSQAQAAARQLVELARTLEQLIPGYQALQAILFELSGSPGASPGPLREALRGLKGCVYYHGATLGTIRRLLLGETSPAVLIALAAAFQALAQEHENARPGVEQALSALPPAMSGGLSSLLQGAGNPDSVLQKAAAAVQAITGPQIWEAARGRTVLADG